MNHLILLSLSVTGSPLVLNYGYRIEWAMIDIQTQKHYHKVKPDGVPHLLLNGQKLNLNHQNLYGHLKVGRSVGNSFRRVQCIAGCHVWEHNLPCNFL